MQERLREELKAFPGEPSYDDLQNKLPYLDAVLKETCVTCTYIPVIELI